MISTALEQIKEIELLEQAGVFELLDEKVKQVAMYRKKYPETSMTERAEIVSMETDYKITKSGINHHFRKIKDLVKKDQEKTQE